jgi:hypothetical protein
LDNCNGNGKRLTNREAAQTDEEFRQACEDAGVPPSRQQFRKWKYRRGLAYQTKFGLVVDSRQKTCLSD